MYHVTVTDRDNIIADSLVYGLADAVVFGRDVGHKGNCITVYESVQDATGEILHLEETLKVYLEE